MVSDIYFKIIRGMEEWVKVDLEAEQIWTSCIITCDTILSAIVFGTFLHKSFNFKKKKNHTHIQRLKSREVTKILSKGQLKHASRILFPWKSLADTMS